MPLLTELWNSRLGNCKYFASKRGGEIAPHLLSTMPCELDLLRPRLQKVFGSLKVAFDLKGFLRILWYMTRTKISKAFQTTLSAEAIRRLGLRPGQRVNQIVEGNRLILEPVEDVDALAGSLGKGNRAHRIEEMKVAARKAITEAGSAGLRIKK